MGNIPHRTSLIFLIALALYFGGCKRNAYTPPPEIPSDQLPGLADSLKVDVYFDATLSMQGFIVPGTNSYYQQTLPLLESAVDKGWSNGHAKFYKFGSRIDELQGRGHLVAAQSDFYNNPEFNKKTFIENVIDAASVENLTVIVTDLFQDNADVNLLTKRLKEKYIINNFAIGVIGIKSEFAGPIYDVGINNYKFDYKSNEADPESYRPFYVLLLGKHADIAHYYEMLEKSGLGNFPVKNFVIFSSHLGNPVATFDGGKINTTNNLVEVSNLLSVSAKDGRIKQFRVRDAAKPASFSATLKYSPLSYTVGSNPPALEPEITGWRCDPGKTDAAPKPGGEQAGTKGEGAEAGHEASKSPVDAPEVSRTFQVKSAGLSGSDLKFECALTPASLTGNGIYCFRMILRPKEYPLPSWISEWDMNTRQIEEWKRNPRNFNGSTTFNLAHFLGDLWDTVVQTHRPKVAEVYCYIQKG
jgi:hypothetical protein